MGIDQLIKILHRMVELQEEMLSELKIRQDTPHPITNDLLNDLIDQVDVKSILKISDSTLYRIKKSKLVRSVRIGKRDYFSKNEIKKLANYFLK